MTQTKSLQTIWWEWIGTSERLMRSLHEQTAAIMLRDVDRVQELQPEIERMIQSLRAIDERASNEAKRLAETIGAEPTFRGLTEALTDAKDKEQLIALANRVRAAAQTIQGLVRKNQALIENELAYVAGTLHLLAQSAQKEQGPYKEGSHAAVLLDEVA
ncbi:MAG: hypothetical protein C4341_00800 [Armatimonadota bacterium]